METLTLSIQTQKLTETDFDCRLASTRTPCEWNDVVAFSSVNGSFQVSLSITKKQNKKQLNNNINKIIKSLSIYNRHFKNATKIAHFRFLLD